MILCEILEEQYPMQLLRDEQCAAQEGGNRSCQNFIPK